MPEDKDDPGRHLSSAGSAAIRWAETHPDDDVEHESPSHVPEDERIVPDRHSASAEAASLRWDEQHDE
jgi:hypothetical protein